ncbi:monovalent cation/H+ antiporter complex subunit F [Actinomadura terrae]|uniref:monovalent cation/H+ antiporter complex subunit F n=1 Tax=Actinomadura terrae TaxID=604353 RepID=UPI001FA72528|nr:monovalent cation/H+ antiporter complex subunit F [Actinomadura terrae]
MLLVAGLVPCLAGTLRGEPVSRLAALAAAGPATSLLLVVLAAAYHRSAYLDAALVLAVLSVAGILVYARFLGRTL